MVHMKPGTHVTSGHEEMLHIYSQQLDFLNLISEIWLAADSHFCLFAQFIFHGFIKHFPRRRHVNLNFLWSNCLRFYSICS